MLARLQVDQARRSHYLLTPPWRSAVRRLEWRPDILRASHDRGRRTLLVSIGFVCIPGSGARLDEDAFGNAFNYKVITRMGPYIKPHIALMTLAIVAMLLFTGTQVAIPWLIKIGIDNFIVEGDKVGLTWIVGFFMANALLNWGANFTQELTIARVGQKLLYSLRRDMFHHLQNQSVSFYDKNEVGRIMSRVLGDVYQLQEFLSVAVVTVGDLSVSYTHLRAHETRHDLV